MPPPVTVRPVASRRDRKAFLDFPYRHYAGHPYWVPPLRIEQKEVLSPKKNPFFEHGRLRCFLAESGGETVGRVAGIVNGMHLKTYDDGNGFFGFFECVERYDVAEALLDAAADWLRAQGMTGVRGPTNPTMNDVSGLLVDGFERRPFVMMPYNPAYYVDYLERYGFMRAMTMWAYYFHTRYADMDRVRRGAAIVVRRNPDVTVRPIDMKAGFEADARAILAIYNAAWSDNWGHVDFTDAEFEHLAANLKQIAEPSAVLLLEKAGTPVAFTVTLPNLNEALVKIPDGRLFPFGLARLLFHAKVIGFREGRNLLMGVVPEHRGKGFDILLHARLIENGARLGWVSGELSWVLESNTEMMNLADRLGALKDKEYAMYERPL